MANRTTNLPATKRPRRMARQPSIACSEANVVKPLNKSAQILAMLERPDGASLAQLVELTGWLPHTTRAALTGLKKRGHAIISEKADSLRMYRIVVPGRAA